MLQQLLQGRLFGHPIHPMLVHFPTALFSTSFLFDMAAFAGFGKDFFTASIYCMGMGLAGGLLAAIFGLIDYNRLAGKTGDGEEVFQKASWHAGMQFLVLSIFGIVFGTRYEGLYEITEPRMLKLVLSGLGVLLMLAGNYLGGDLVFRDGVGVLIPGTDPSDRSEGSDG